MMKRTNKTRGVNQVAFDVAKLSTGDVRRLPEREKNAAAVELGRLGGLRGGKARAIKLSAKQRSEIAKNAARARWAKHPHQEPGS